MPTLIRRRADSDQRETWHVYYGDVHVGTISRRAGVPVHADQWGWACGFYPGLEPGQHRDGTAMISSRRVPDSSAPGPSCCRS